MRTIFQDKDKSDFEKWMWTLIMIFGWAGIILMWVVTYITKEPYRYIDHNFKIWYEKWILPFYFTHVSNLLGAVLATIMFFRIDNKIKKINYFKILNFANLLVTMVIFLTVLLPKGFSRYTIFKWFEESVVHIIVPCLYISIFIYNCLKKNDFNWNPKIWLVALKLFIFPLIWLAIATIIYISSGMQPAAAIYGFLKFYQQKWYISCIWIFGIGISYYLIAFLGTWLSIQKTNK